MVPPKAVQLSGVFCFQVSGVSVQVLEDRGQVAEDRQEKQEAGVFYFTFTRLSSWQVIFCLPSSVY
jgi:hypothetical protein